MTGPLGGKSMGDRCLIALESLGGEATSDEVRAQAEADWGRPLTTAQVAVALASLAREHCPKITRHPAPEGGFFWRTAEAATWPDPVRPWAGGFPAVTVTDAEAAEALARELPLLGAAVASAVREAP
jgi:hypothetical protein